MHNDVKGERTWSGRADLNGHEELGRLTSCHWTTPAKLVAEGRLELPTSRLSIARSKPAELLRNGAGRRIEPPSRAYRARALPIELFQQEWCHAEESNPDLMGVGHRSKALGRARHWGARADLKCHLRLRRPGLCPLNYARKTLEPLPGLQPGSSSLGPKRSVH